MKTKNYNDLFKKMTNEIVEQTDKALKEAEAARWTCLEGSKPKKITVDGREAVLL